MKKALYTIIFVVSTMIPMLVPTQLAAAPPAEEVRLQMEAVVNINQATVDDLQAMILGVGATKAAAIVAYRDANGPFKNVQELTQVKGIGQSILDKNRNRLVVE
ncbi:MAG TPA: competence protein ComEA [Gammaproteobacteria bacterium]|nr:competence protein ComEA [Gammaproteobacteria bacterium]